jgi:hypothetical protein
MGGVLSCDHRGLGITIGGLWLPIFSGPFRHDYSSYQLVTSRKNRASLILSPRDVRMGPVPQPPTVAVPVPMGVQHYIEPQLNGVQPFQVAGVPQSQPAQAFVTNDDGHRPML